MPRTPIPVANGFYVDDTLLLSAQECTNYYPTLSGTPVLNQETLSEVPGINLLVSSGTSITDRNRGSHVLKGIPYFVNGNTLYRLESDTATLTSLGTIEGDGDVFMENNETQLFILVPGNPSIGYVFTTDPDTLTIVTDPDFLANGNPMTVLYIDGYFLFTVSGKKYILSALNDGLSYNALDFGSAEASPDSIVSAVTLGNQLYIAGSETIEVFQNVGGADFPFRRTGQILERGVHVAATLISTGGNVLFLGGGEGESTGVWLTTGGDPVKVSTIAVDKLIQSFGDKAIATAFAWAHIERGAHFVGFTFPTTSLVFDLVSKRWHERKSRLRDALGESSLTRWRVNSIVSAYGRLIVGDSQGGNIGELCQLNQEYGEIMVRRFSIQPIQNNMESFVLPHVEITTNSGSGNELQPNPRMCMEISKDGGKTWGYARYRFTGKVGEGRKRVIWRRNGRMPRVMVLRFTASDPVPCPILQLTIDIQG